MNLHWGISFFSWLFRAFALALTHLWFIWLSNLFFRRGWRLLGLTSLHGGSFLKGSKLCLPQLPFFFNNLPVFFVFMISLRKIPCIYTVIARLFWEGAGWCNRHRRWIRFPSLHVWRGLATLDYDLIFFLVFFLFAVDVVGVTGCLRDLTWQANLQNILCLVSWQNSRVSASWINYKAVLSYYNLIVIELIVYSVRREIRSWVGLLGLHNYF